MFKTKPTPRDDDVAPWTYADPEPRRRRGSRWADRFRASYIVGVVVATLVAFAMMLPVPAGASSFDSVCNVYGTSCSTAAISPSVYHRVYYKISNSYFCSSHFDVFDARNGVSVRSGNVGTGHWQDGTVSGLYSIYYVHVSRTCGGSQGYISQW